MEAVAAECVLGVLLAGGYGNGGGVWGEMGGGVEGLGNEDGSRSRGGEGERGKVDGQGRRRGREYSRDSGK